MHTLIKKNLVVRKELKLKKMTIKELALLLGYNYRYLSHKLSNTELDKETQEQLIDVIKASN